MRSKIAVVFSGQLHQDQQNFLLQSIMGANAVGNQGARMNHA